MATTVVNEPKPQPDLPAAALAYKYVTFVNRMTTHGYPFATPLSSWRPDLDIGWYYLGQGAAYGDNWTRLLTASLSKHWNLTLSGTSSVGSAVPPNEDYVVVGGIFSDNEGYAEPDSEQKRGIKAIRRDLLVMDGTFQSGIPQLHQPS
ncbi:hypothetical protein BDZ89DRAFT_1134257 [Hymenopellis radicata]|nr:hypothetical protein BDZ89DRAFT_1134257 [Hymenopellis radicata]